jgi:hypothetical protein
LAERRCSALEFTNSFLGLFGKFECRGEEETTRLGSLKETRKKQLLAGLAIAF